MAMWWCAIDTMAPQVDSRGQEDGPYLSAWMQINKHIYTIQIEWCPHRTKLQGEFISWLFTWTRKTEFDSKWSCHLFLTDVLPWISFHSSLTLPLFSDRRPSAGNAFMSKAFSPLNIDGKYGPGLRRTGKHVVQLRPESLDLISTTGQAAKWARPGRHAARIWKAAQRCA